MGRGRKVEKVLSLLPEPTEMQAIVCVTGTPGSNLLEVCDAAGETFLCKVPSKLRNVVWVIKGGHLIVDRFMARGAATGRARSTELCPAHPSYARPVIFIIRTPYSKH